MYNTGYIPPDIVYPPQPVKLAELGGIAAEQVSGRRAFPLEAVCEALGYCVSRDGAVYTVTNGQEAYTIDGGSPETGVIDGAIYVTEALFNELLGLKFRYFEELGILGIFK